jgi:xanthine dehydrogenase accessory factor
MPDGEVVAVLRALLAAVEAGEPVAVATVIATHRSVPRHTGAKLLVRADGTTVGTVGGGEMESRVTVEARAALADGAPRLLRYELIDLERGDAGVCGGEVEIYIEPHLPAPTVLVVGCGHVGRAVVELGHWAGFRVAATDDRAELVTEALLPDADVLLPGPLAEALRRMPVTPATDVVVVTRDLRVDVDALPLLLATPARSIGVIGSTRRWRTTRRALEDRGVPADQLDRVRSPIGLEIHGETPREIALSIVGELVALRRGATSR